MQLAQKIFLPGTSGTPVVIEGPESLNQFDTLGDVISKLLPIVYSVAGLILLLMLIWGGYELLFSAGDQAKIQQGRTRIVNAIIGFFIMFIAYFLSQLVTFIFGFEIF